MKFSRHWSVIAAIVISYLLRPVLMHAASLKPLYGTWKVYAAHLDETLTRTPFYEYNDPRLLGRTINFKEREIRTTFEENTYCLYPSARHAKSELGVLIDSTMGKAEVPRQSGIARFHVEVKDRENFEVWWISCKEGDIGPDTPFGPENQNWVTLLSKDQIAIRWYDNIILLLKKLR